MSPYIEAQVISCQDPKMNILRALEEKAKKRLNVTTSWIERGDEPVLRADYKSEEDLSQNYRRDQRVYETFVRYMQEKEIYWPSLIPNGKIKVEDNEEIYLILKYSTDCKEIIAQNYSFTYKIIDFIGIHSSYEEVYDGFLLFYKSKQDFEDASIDLMNFEKLKIWLENHGMWNKIMQNFFKLLNFENHS